METTPRPTRYTDVSREAADLLKQGESANVEYKRDGDAVYPRTLAALANWITLDEEHTVAHLLVGVEEVTDEDGRTYGNPRTLEKGLDRTVSRLQDITTATYPIPVDTYIIEEAVDTTTPFVRVEVRPTTAPHYDGEGRRQTRQGRSTRPLADEELLGMYLARESGAFATRFRQIGAELQAAVGSVGENIEQISRAIEHTVASPIRQLADSADFAAVAAGSAESSAESAAQDVQQVERMVRDLQGLVADLKDDSVENLASRVVEQRKVVWWNFTVDTWERSSRQAECLTKHLLELLSADVSLSDAVNTWEIRLWKDLTNERLTLTKGRGTLKWWGEAIVRVAGYRETPSYAAPELPDLRGELREDVDRALDDSTSLTRRFAADLPGRPLG